MRQGLYVGPRTDRPGIHQIMPWLSYTLDRCSGVLTSYKSKDIFVCYLSQPNLTLLLCTALSSYRRSPRCTMPKGRKSAAKTYVSILLCISCPYPSVSAPAQEPDVVNAVPPSSSPKKRLALWLWFMFMCSQVDLQCQTQGENPGI